MRRVIVESPFSGDIERNLKYLRAAMHDCLTRNETPFASHAIYTQEGVLDDTVPTERALGIKAGFAWRSAADATIVFVDLGFSSGMRAGIQHAEALKAAGFNHDIEYRSLEGWKDQQ